MTLPNNSSNNQQWYEDDTPEEDEGYPISEYDITATPNDFNILTIYQFIESGAVKIPGFQRNYVWALPRASKLIESLIIGLPVPQIFLYEESRNSFLVIDGQQRLMSIYYFIKQRFPKMDKRPQLREIFDKYGGIPNEVLFDDGFFDPFSLNLPPILPDRPNRFNELNYSTLKDYRTQFDMRPVRNVVIKQNAPANDNSAMFEIFTRLNTGQEPLRPQEIRMSLFHSNFFDMLRRINAQPSWRKLLGQQQPDLHMKDVEILLRSYAMLIEGNDYKPSMVKFLNDFSKKCQSFGDNQNRFLESLFDAFLKASAGLSNDTFLSQNTRRFSFALFEAVFSATCAKSYEQRTTDIPRLVGSEIKRLENDQEFRRASLEGSTGRANVRTRLQKAKEIVTHG